MTDLSDFKLPTFKEVHGDFSEYLLSRLKLGDEISEDECSAQLRRGGFANSTRLLKNTTHTKTVVTALHIPDREGKIHHYDISFYRFSRTKPSDPADWQRKSGFSLRKEEVQILYKFLTEQNKLLGIKFDEKYVNVVFSDTEVDTKELLEKVSVIAKSQGGDAVIDKLVDEIIKNSKNVESKILTIGFTENLIEKRRKELDKFENLIDNSSSKEVSDIQADLKKMPWIFGPEYASYDYKKAGDEIPDGRLKRIDELSDILEVKLPNEEVLRVNSIGRRYVSPKCAEAIGQLTSYLEYYQSSYSTEYDDKTEEEITDDRHQKYYKPKGILLIGRRDKTKIKGTAAKSDNHPKFMRRLMSYFHGIEILTYDDILERARNALNILEQKM